MASSGSERPLVGITTYLEQARWGAWDRRVALLPQVYLDCVHRAGGVPVLLPPLPDGAAEALTGLDALVVAGGGDVDPGAYGAPAHPQTADVRPERDTWEVALLRAALARDLPVLGVCRGAQVLNVATGGSLHQHLPDEVGSQHHRPAPATFGTVRVTLVPGSRLARALGAEADVPCYHHQGLARLGQGVSATARAGDGTVEGIELDRHSFAVGVQWHPEQDAGDLRVFQALVAAAHSARTAAPVVAAPAPAPTPEHREVVPG